MNNFGVVYMSTVGRGLIVGAPEGTKFITGMKRVNVTAAARMFIENRTLHVSAPGISRLSLFSLNGRLLLSKDMGSNALTPATSVSQV